jgi:hypothetical protein
MNSFYHKVAVACVCTALSFTLGANKEAKAALHSCGMLSANNQRKFSYDLS